MTPQRPRLLLTAGRRVFAHVEQQFCARLPAAPAAAAIGVLAVDLVISSNSWSIPVLGGLDEVGHLFTAAIILLALPLPAGRRLAPWALLGAVTIDADHVPLYTFAKEFSVGGRPPTHSFVTALALLSAGSALPAVRIPCVGLALGVCLHFVRDVSTGPGLPLFWPVADVSVRWPFTAYLVILGVATVAATARLRRRRTSPPG